MSTDDNDIGSDGTSGEEGGGGDDDDNDVNDSLHDLVIKCHG